MFGTKLPQWCAVIHHLRRASSNWAGNIHHAAPIVHVKSIDELQTVVADAAQVRMIGTGHSFVNAANVDSTSGTLLSLNGLEERFELDSERSEVTVDGGMTYTRLARLLRGTGFALKNTHSLPHTTVSGTIATGTHGSSGVHPVTKRALHASQSEHITAIEFVCPNGDLRKIDKSDDDFKGSVISLGCLGPIASLTVELVPEFMVLQSIYGQMATTENTWPTQDLIVNFQSLLESCDSMSVMVDWPGDNGGMVVTRHYYSPDDDNIPAPNPTWCGVPLVTEPLPPLLGTNKSMRSTHSAISSDILFWFIEDGEVFGPQPPDELQLEYFVPLEAYKEALETVRAVASSWGGTVNEDPLKRPQLLYCELRVVAADDLWLSPTTTLSGGDTLALAFGMNKYDQTSAMKCARDMETALQKFKPKPHWAKLHAMTPTEVQAAYGDEIKKFAELRYRIDPKGKFSNEWSQSYGL